MAKAGEGCACVLSRELCSSLARLASTLEMAVFQIQCSGGDKAKPIIFKKQKTKKLPNVKVSLWSVSFLTHGMIP